MKIAKLILKTLPMRAILDWLISLLIELIDERAKQAWDKVWKYVIEAERKYLGRKKGEEKFRYVKQKLEEEFKDLPEYVKRLLIELAVTKLHLLAGK